MAVLAGTLAATPIGAITNERLSPALSSLGADYWPAHDSHVGELQAASVASQTPVSTAPRLLAGAVQPHYFDDFYNRIHIHRFNESVLQAPRLDLGNVATEVQVKINVWNAFTVAQTLTVIDGLEGGLSLVGPDVFPMAFPALLEQDWDLVVPEVGPVVIDTVLVWDFVAVNDQALPVTGTRIVPWAFTPDWSVPIRETIAWHTSALGSESRVIQRRQARLSPRRFFAAQFQVHQRERVLFDLAMHGWGGRVWALPIFPDIQLLAGDVDSGALTIPCTTDGRDFREGGMAFLRRDDAFTYEVARIEHVEADQLVLQAPLSRDWPALSRLYPSLSARLTRMPDAGRMTDRDDRASAEFIVVEANDWPAAVLPQYRGFGVYDERPDESSELSHTWEHLLQTLDNVSGIPQVRDTALFGFAVYEHRWLLESIDDRADWRGLIYALRGAQVPVWVPTHADDIDLTETVQSASLALSIEAIGYTRFGLGQPGRSDIRMELLDGTVFYRHIDASTEVDETRETLTIDTPLGQNVLPADVLRISFLALMTGEDTVELEHVTDVEGVARSGMTFVTVRDDDV